VDEYLFETYSLSFAFGNMYFTVYILHKYLDYGYMVNLQRIFTMYIFDISRRPESEAFKFERSRSVDPRLICFKLKAALHQCDVGICIKMNTPQLVLEIRQLSGLPIAL